MKERQLAAIESSSAPPELVREREADTMETVRVNAVLDKDGEINVKGLPFKKGQEVEIILLAESPSKFATSTARRLRNSSLVGMWKDRKDIGDSVKFARELRRKAERRQG